MVKWGTRSLLATSTEPSSTTCQRSQAERPENAVPPPVPFLVLMEMLRCDLDLYA